MTLEQLKNRAYELYPSPVEYGGVKVIDRTLEALQDAYIKGYMDCYYEDINKRTKDKIL